MRNQYSKETRSGSFKTLSLMLLGLVVLATTGCNFGGPDGDDGSDVTNIILPTDTQLDLSCINAGLTTVDLNTGQVAAEDCVLDDNANPYRYVATGEFDENDPDADIGKFLLEDAIPAGPTGAKARFYLWATALARRNSGENQYKTAKALHELYTAQPLPDPLVKEQALKAYRSVLEYYFGEVTFFEFLTPSGLANIPNQLNLLVGDDMSRPLATADPVFYPAGFAQLFPADTYPDTFAAVTEIGDWGFTYIPCTEPPFSSGIYPDNCPNNGSMYIN
ncbi:MAG: hypothetical protein WBN57_12345 [Gammaproteobacteria bacterium]